VHVVPDVPPAPALVTLDYAAPAESSSPPPRLDYSNLWAGRPPYMPIWRVVIAHLLTGSLFSILWFQSLHDRLPRTRDDDPSAFKAIFWLFVPLVNLYWVFFAWMRLCDRVAEQRKLHGLPPSDTKGLCVFACALMLVPYVNLVSIFLIQPALFACLQAEVNELHHLGFAHPRAGELPVANAVPVFDFAMPQ
jgi:hypothetical protein